MLFWKMNGLGNDYVYIDVERFASKQEKKYLDNNIEKLTKRLSDRHFGIGGDGVVLMLPSENADIEMRIFNSDGSEGAMCGNALRCVAKYLWDSDIVKTNECLVDTKSGTKRVIKDFSDGDVTIATADIGDVLSERIADGMFTVDCGNKHIVIAEDVAELDFANARELSVKYDKNVELFRVIDDKSVSARVYERGSGETLACGTGAIAVAYVARTYGFVQSDTVDVRLPGGCLSVTLYNNRAYLKGEARLNYMGEVDIRKWL